MSYVLVLAFCKVPPSSRAVECVRRRCLVGIIVEFVIPKVSLKSPPGANLNFDQRRHPSFKFRASFSRTHRTVEIGRSMILIKVQYFRVHARHNSHDLASSDGKRSMDLQIALLQRKRIFSARESSYIATSTGARNLLLFTQSGRERSSYFGATAAATAQHPANSRLAISLSGRLSLASLFILPRARVTRDVN